MSSVDGVWFWDQENWCLPPLNYWFPPLPPLPPLPPRLTNDTNSVAFFTPGPRPQYMCSDWLIAVAPALPTKRGEHTKVDRKLIPAEILEQSNRQCHDKQEDEDCSQTRAKTRRMQFYNIKFRFMNSRWILYQKCASLPWSPLCRYLQLKTL